MNRENIPTCFWCGQEFETELLYEEHRNLWGHQCQANVETLGMVEIVEKYEKGKEPFVEFEIKERFTE